MRIARFALALVRFAAATAPATAPSQGTFAVEVQGRATPGGAVIATFLAGAPAREIGARGGEVHVSLDGWAVSMRLGGPRDSFPASVNGTVRLRVRSAPSADGAVLGELLPGAGVSVLGKSGTWTHVRRGVWVTSNAITGRAVAGGTRAAPKAPPKAPPRAAPPAATKPAPVQERAALPPRVTATVSAASPAQSPRLVVPNGAKLRESPLGKPIGEIGPGTVVEPIARQYGWVRVRTEGWVNERELVAAESLAAPSVTAADLRANPEGFRGRVVEWDIQVLSLQTADPLRPDFVVDEPYLLAKGPGRENALLYLAVPPSLVAQARALPPLARVIVSARVRNGHSPPVGTPLLDILSMRKP